jgi:hypothetical protein
MNFAAHLLHDLRTRRRNFPNRLGKQEFFGFALWLISPRSTSSWRGGCKLDTPLESAERRIHSTDAG